MATVLLIGTLDTKGPETAYLRDQIQARGCQTLVLDSGILGEAKGITADFNRQLVAEAAGTNIDTLRSVGVRGKAIEEMLKGVRQLTVQLFEEGKIHGVASLGGAEGAVLAAAAMKVLPVGFPKLIVSPLASGHRKFAPFVGTKDVMVMHSVVDILGLNPVSRRVFDSAAGSISGMAQAYETNNADSEKTAQSIAATMLGNTTRPLMHIKPHIEERGYDFVIFHANGVGGPAMEELIEQNYFAGILDYTLSEIAGQIAGGFHDGGSSRLDAAANHGVPQVIVPGCLDFVVFGAAHEVPEQYAGRPTYYHNPEFTLVRLTADEQVQAAEFVVNKLNMATNKVSVVVPLRGGSVMDIEGGAFWDTDINERVWNVFRQNLKPEITYNEVDKHINDNAFAEVALQELIQVIS